MDDITALRAEVERLRAALERYKAVREKWICGSTAASMKKSFVDAVFADIDAALEEKP